MTYYRVRPEYDQVHLYRKDRKGRLVYDNFLIANELYTPGELKQLLSKKMFGRSTLKAERVFQKINAKKTQTYWFFGARWLSEN